MTVGTQISSSQIDNQISTIAVQLRNLMVSMQNLYENVNGQSAGLAFLEGIGYSPADAQSALTAISLMNTLALVYEGEAAASQYNYNQTFSQYWAGQ